MDLPGDRSKVRCCKEQYCIGTWNVRSVNQDKLEVVKQEMARVNINILGISEVRWTGMGEFNSDERSFYYCGQESLRQNGVAIMINKRVPNAVLVSSELSPVSEVFLPYCSSLNKICLVLFNLSSFVSFDSLMSVRCLWTINSRFPAVLCFVIFLILLILKYQVNSR